MTGFIVMDLEINGILELPEKLTERQFTDLFYGFLSQHGIQFGGGWKETLTGEDMTQQQDNQLKSGIELIAEERQRQIEVEFYSVEDDAARYNENSETENDLVLAAAAYALPEKLNTVGLRENLLHRSNLFPWDKSWWKPTPDNRIKELQKAGALIAAEIDRLQHKNLRK